jgi:hypothetical protein
LFNISIIVTELRVGAWDEKIRKGGFEYGNTKMGAFLRANELEAGNGQVV